MEALSRLPSVASLISTAHLSLRRTKGAQRRGQLQPGFGGGVGGRRGGRRSLELSPPPLRTLRPPQVRPGQQEHSCEGLTHGLGQRAGGQAPPLGDNQRSHLNAFQSARGGGAQATSCTEGSGPRPPPRPLFLCLSHGALRGGRRGSSAQSGSWFSECGVLLTQVGWALLGSRGLISAGDRFPT